MCCELIHLIDLYLTLMFSYRQMDHAAGFSSEACPEAIVCIAQNALRLDLFHTFTHTHTHTQ
jgi:hypothetical protein